MGKKRDTTPDQGMDLRQGRTMQQAAQVLWHQQRIKRLVRDRLTRGAQCLVSVRETQCTDPNCPGPATEIRIVALDFREERFVIHKPLAEITGADLGASD